MILAIIFLITDLFMVGIAYAVYGRTAVAGYRWNGSLSTYTT